MNSKIGKIYKLKITSLSPLHIGDNIDFEPTNYVIGGGNSSSETCVCPECGYVNRADAAYCSQCDAELQSPASAAGGAFLYTFSPKQLSEALSAADKQRLLDIAKKGDIFLLQEFFKNNISKITSKATKHARVCPEISMKYKEKYGNTEAQRGKENQFIIEKNISNPLTDTAYIPGSSIKGALRTALMSAKNKVLKLKPEDYEKWGKYDSKRAEQTLYAYQNITDDPFKYLKLSDSAPEKDFLSEICMAHNYKRSQDIQQESIPVYIETIPPQTVFTTEMSINTTATDKAGEFSEDMASICSACNYFYGSIMALEQSYLTTQPQLYAKLKQAMQKPNTFIIRVGKCCGAENVTIDGLRRIKNRQSNRYMSNSTTYWLADNGVQKLPFGWCIVEYESK